jgi:hypothetical protein
MLCVLPNCPLDGPNAFLYELALEFVTTGIGEAKNCLLGKLIKAEKPMTRQLCPRVAKKQQEARMIETV